MAFDRGQPRSPIPACLTFPPLLPPLLNIGTAFAMLQSDGASPNSMELLKILVTRPAISCASSLRARGEAIPSTQAGGHGGPSVGLPWFPPWPCPRCRYRASRCFVLTKSGAEMSVHAQISPDVIPLGLASICRGGEPLTAPPGGRCQHSFAMALIALPSFFGTKMLF